MRCIAASRTRAPWDFDAEHVTEQLRASGMLEAVRVRSLAFAHREDAEAFAARVAPLLLGTSTPPTPGGAAACAALCAAFGLPASQWAAGRTKVFLRKHFSTSVERALVLRVTATRSAAAARIARAWRRLVLRRRRAAAAAADRGAV